MTKKKHRFGAGSCEASTGGAQNRRGRTKRGGRGQVSVDMFSYLELAVDEGVDNGLLGE